MSFEPPALNATQQRIVDSLRAEGIAILRYEELLADPSLDELAADIAPFIRESEVTARDARAIPKNKGDFILRRFVDKGEGAEKPRLSLDSPWLRVAASKEVLDTINAYRGEETLLHNVDNWYTIPHSAAEERIASQRWHRDPEEEHVVKVFVYLSDVDDEAGPFEYVSGSPTGGRYGDFWPWNIKKRHPPEEELYEAIAPEDRLTMTGPPGTMFFCDTGGFHRGGFARTKPRVLATWSFVAPASGKKHRFEVDLDRPVTDLPPQVRTALV